MKRDPWGEFKDAPGDDPWSEFADATPTPRSPTVLNLAPSGAVIDGDTYRTQSGPNVRLFGADAFELRQQGRTLGGDPVPLGQKARGAFGYFARPGASAQATGSQTWGRPVASLSFGGTDAGESLIRQGLAVPVPRYLQRDEPEGLTNELPPHVRANYIGAQRDAIASETGAYSGRFQIPEDFRKLGNAAPWQGKVTMTPDQAAAWGRLVRDPTTTPEQAGTWLASQGQSAENVRNVVRFLSRNPQAEANPAFQQRDAEGNPVQPEPRGLLQRSLDALNEGIIDIAAAPFDLSHAIATPIGNLLGVDMSAGSPYSSGIRDAWHGLGLGQRDEGSAPRSDLERYGQAFLRGTGSAIIPVGGTLGVGSKLATRTPSLATQASAARTALRDSLVDAARSPGTAVALELGAGAGSYMGEEVAHDAAPGDPYASLAGQMIGGLGGGFAGGAAGRRMGARSSGDAVVPARAPEAPDAAMFDDAAPMVERDGALFAKLADGREVPIPIDPSGKPGVTWTVNGWEALLEVGPDGAGQYGPQNIPNALPSPYRDLANQLNGVPLRQRDRLTVPQRGAVEPVQSRGDAVNTAPPARQPAAPRGPEVVTGAVRDWSQGLGAREQGDGPIPDVMLHGSPYGNIDEFDPYGRGGYGLFGMGTYLTDNPGIAASYTKKQARKLGADADRSVYAVRQTVKNPLDMDAPANRAEWEATADRVLREDGADFFRDLPESATNEQYWREVEDYLSREQVTASEGAETMDALVRSLGRDGITHLGGGRVGNGPRHRVVIALDPEQTSIVDRMSIEQMLNPRQPRNPDWIDIAQQPAQSGRGVYTQNMDAETGRQVLVGPDPWAEFADADASPGPVAPRQRDYIDLTQPRRMMADAPDMERLAAANRIRPGDVLPVPSSTIDGIDEALGIERGRYQREAAGNPRAALETRGYRDPENGLKTIRRKGPPDLVTWLRSEGGLALSGRDAGEFRHAGIDNKPRNDLEFAKGEDKLGNLLDDERGMPLDYAAMRAWEAGYFPDLTERPTIDEFMDALVSTHRGGSGRVFHPDDLPELDRYREADAQYQAVKAAQQDGATLLRDRGEPVTLDDMEANAAPVSAYEEWGENAPDFAGNIRLDGLDSPQSIKRALDTTDKRVGGFDAARRGRVAQAETERLASELGMTPDDLLKRRKGQAFNAEEALAARQILAKSANELVNMARRISRTDGDPSTVDAARFREAWLRHVAIQEQVAGMTAEAGRALQQFRQVADARAVRGTVLPEMIERAGGARGIKDAADMIVDHADDPAKLNKLTEQALKPGLKDKLLELWYNSLLSGPQTHAVNILSNTITSLLQIPEHAAAAVIGAPRRLLGSEADSVIFSEVGARTVGLLAGTREGLREAARTFRTGEPSDLMSKVETQEQNAIPGRLGKVLRTPTRALAAEDELFKAMARRMELHGLAIRKASAEGLRGQAARARAAELIANPTDEMLSQAFDYGRYLTFQRPLSSGHGVSLAAQMLTSRAPILKLVLPFVRTPANLLKFALERSPAAPIVKEWRKDFGAGGSRRDLAVARMMVGTGVVALVTQTAAQGLITGGGPADDGARAMLEADGWQPYSFRIGDQYYSYQRLDPLASTFGIAADLVDLQSHMTEGQREKSAQLLVAATLKNLSNKTWLSGVSDAVEAINDPERRAENYMARLAGSVAVPAGVAQVARVVDPVLREAREPMDRIRSRIPGLSSSLPARRDVLGNEMVSEGGLGPDIMSPIWTRARRNDPVVDSLLESEISITKPQRKVRDPISGRMIELTPFQFEDYQALTGDLARPRLSALVQGGEWRSLNPGEQEKAVDKVMRGARSEARGLLLSALRDPAAPSGNDPWAEFQDAGKSKADPWREFADAP